MKLSNKVAIVTGSGRGIGKAIAKLLASEGATVVVDDIHVENMNRTAKEINEAGGKAMPYEMDVSNRLGMHRMVKDVVDKFGAIHILVNNAGVTRHLPILQVGDEDWDLTLNVDCKGVFNGIQAVTTYMMNQRYGKIVSIASIAAMGSANGGMSSYAAAKAGVIALTKVATRELSPYGVNVNAIAPGTVFTEMTQASRSGAALEQFIKDRESVSIMKRLVKPEDIAKTALFLVSEDASAITGQIIRVDVGRIDFM